MTKKVDLLIGEPCPELLCGICSDVLEDPLQVHCPEDHMFCKKCIEHHITQQPTCPLCMTNLDSNSFQLSKFAQRQISRLRIKCLYADNGCNWTGLFSDNHQAECKFKPLVCPNADKGCTENLTEFNKDDHIQQCPYKLMTCPNQMPLCKPFLLKELEKHDSECQSYACPYSNEGCPFIGTRPQTNMHCEHYCGRLHQRIGTLEAEVKRLNKLIQDFAMGFSLNLPQTPETSSQERSPTAVKPDHQQNSEDIAMGEMDLFHQMFNGDPFGALANTATTNVGSTVTSNGQQANDSAMTDLNSSMMDINACLTDMNFLDPTATQTTDAVQLPNTSSSANTLPISTTPTATTTTTAGTTTALTLPNMTTQPLATVSTRSADTRIEDAASPPALEFVPPLTAPKRASNGKRIRYSKNLKLAHNALRMARQRTTSNTGTINNDTIHNPSNDAILNNFNIAKQQKKNQITFKHMNDVLSEKAHDHNLSMMNSSSNSNTSKSSSNTSKKERKRSTTTTPSTSAANTNSTTSPSPAPTTPQPATASSPGPHTNTSTTPKRKPMFILASSYLSNYNSNTSSKNTNDDGIPTTDSNTNTTTTTLDNS